MFQYTDRMTFVIWSKEHRMEKQVETQVTPKRLARDVMTIQNEV